MWELRSIAAAGFSIALSACLARSAASAENAGGHEIEVHQPGPLASTICFFDGEPKDLKTDVACPVVGTMYADALNVLPHKFERGFPTVSARTHWYELDYKGYFHVNTAGDYAFRIFSQDGSIVWVDDQLLIDNDGLHEPVSKSGNVHLASGKHSLRVLYFHGGGDNVALQLFVTPPGGTERLWTSKL